MRFVWSFVLLVAIGCTSEATEIRVSVTATPELQRTVATLVIQTFGGVRSAAELNSVEVARWPIRDWPVDLAVRPQGGDANRRVRVEVDALDSEGRVVAESELEANFVAGASLERELRLGSDCPCDAGERCVEDRCVPELADGGMRGDAEMELDSGAPLSPLGRWDFEGLARFEISAAASTERFSVAVGELDENATLLVAPHGAGEIESLGFPVEGAMGTLSLVDVTALSDGAFVAVGNSTVGSAVGDGWLLRVAEDGTVTESAFYSGGSGRLRLGAVCPLEGDGFVAVGTHRDGAEAARLVAMVFESGTLSSSDLRTLRQPQVEVVDCLARDGFVFVAANQGVQSEGVVVAFDVSAFEVEWERYLGTPSEVSALGIAGDRLRLVGRRGNDGFSLAMEVGDGEPFQPLTWPGSPLLDFGMQGGDFVWLGATPAVWWGPSEEDAVQLAPDGSAAMSQGERFASYWTQHPTEGLSLRRVRVSANPPCTEPLSVQAPTRDETVLVAEAGHPADEFSPSASDGPLGERSVFRGRSTCVGE